jgi:UTP--glucose-1-phosphate uridylyltransferase
MTKTVNVTRAVVTAAGLGTRFLPWSKVLPKEMVPLLGRPALDYTLEELEAAGIEQVLFIVSRGKECIVDHFDLAPELERILAERGKEDMLAAVRPRSSMQLHYVRQPEPKGLGHAVLEARSFVQEQPFVLVLPDELYLSSGPAAGQLIELHESTGDPVIGLMRVPPEDVSRYGIVEPSWASETDCELIDMVEKPAQEKAPSNTAICGRYVLTPDVFDELEQTQPGAGGEIQLTDGLRELLDKRTVRGRVIDGERLDLGTMSAYLQSLLRMALRDPDYRKLLTPVIEQELEGPPGVEVHDQ